MTATFFGNPDLYYVFPDYWDEGYAFNPDFTPGEYSGSPLGIISAEWFAFGLQEGEYTGSVLSVSAGDWEATGSGVGLYAGSTAVAIPAVWESDKVFSAAPYTGGIATISAALWDAGAGAAAFYTGGIATIGSFTILPPAGWSASGSATASYAGAAVNSIGASISGSGDGSGEYQSLPAFAVAATWQGAGSAVGLYTGVSASSSAALWEAGVTAFYSGITVSTTAADWDAFGAGTGLYLGSQTEIFDGLWTGLAVGDPLAPAERQPLPPRITNRGYGSSDITAPSFNRTQYVKHGSIHEPLDLGILDDADIFIDGAAGGEHGSHTIFYRFQTSRPLRIGARILPPGERSSTRQQPGGQWDPTNLYIKVSATDSNRRRLESGDKVFLPEGELPSARFRALAVDIGYAAAGHWETGYTDGDDLKQNVTAEINYYTDAGLVQPNFAFIPALVVVDPATNTFIAVPPIFEPLPDPRAGLHSAVQPAGTFTLAVSNSQWTEIPYTLQVALRVKPDLRGTAGLQLDAKGRIPVADTSGTAELQLLPEGFIPRSKSLAGEALLQLKPRAALRRISPFD